MDVGHAALHAMDAAFPTREPITPATEDRGLHARMRVLEKHHGSGAAAARALGISPGTWSRWKAAPVKGKRVQRPSGGNLGRLVQAARKLYQGARVAGARRRLAHVHSTGTAVMRWTGYYNPSPHRSVNFEPADLRSLIDPWLAGDAEAAGLAYQEAISAAQGVEWDPANPAAGVWLEGEDVNISIHG